MNQIEITNATGQRFTMEPVGPVHVHLPAPRPGQSWHFGNAAWAAADVVVHHHAGTVTLAPGERAVVEYPVMRPRRPATRRLPRRLSRRQIRRLLLHR